MIERCSPAIITSTYLDAMNDNEVVKYTEARHTLWTHSSATRFIESSNHPESSMLASIKLLGCTKYIGNIRLFSWHKIHRRCELSFLIYDKSEWSKGYATEAISIFLNFAVGRFGIHRIVADYYASNSASKFLFKKLGFEIEGVFREHFFVDGGYCDSVRVGKIYE